MLLKIRDSLLLECNNSVITSERSYACQTKENTFQKDDGHDTKDAGKFSRPAAIQIQETSSLVATHSGRRIIAHTGHSHPIKPLATRPIRRHASLAVESGRSPLLLSEGQTGLTPVNERRHLKLLRNTQLFQRSFSAGSIDLASAEARELELMAQMGEGRGSSPGDGSRRMKLRGLHAKAWRRVKNVFSGGRTVETPPRLQPGKQNISSELSELKSN